MDLYSSKNEIHWEEVFYFATVYTGIMFGLFHYYIVFVVFHSRATCLVTCGRTGAALLE